LLKHPSRIPINGVFRFRLVLVEVFLLGFETRVTFQTAMEEFR
jgi:hypothetical protein